MKAGEIELAGQDLNLLVVLRTLLDTRSVSAAGHRLGLSPSATSHALARIREAFGDPMLVRQGNAMVATPHAESLRPSLERLLDETRRLYQEAPAFEPGTATRGFTLAAADLLAPLAPGLVAGLAREAPGIDLSLVGDVWLSDPGAFTSGGIDLALQAVPAPSLGLASRRLGEVDFVVVARDDHPFLSAPDLEAWCAFPHVAIGTPRPGSGYVAEAAARAGVERRVALRVPTFLLALHVLTDTSLLCTAPGPLARPIAARLGLAVRPVPLPVPGVSVAAVWHDRFESDPAHRWFRDFVHRTLSPHFLEAG